MRTVYGVFNEHDDLIEPLYDNEQDAKDYIEDSAKRDWASMKARPDRYPLEGEMVSKWHEDGGYKRYDATDEGHMAMTGKWIRVFIQWFIKPLKLQERSND